MSVQLVLSLAGMVISLAIIALPAVLVLGDLYFNGPSPAASPDSLEPRSP
ncbi:MAG TPA: hypothetical protein VGE68_00585 [Sphingomicrobium sp.]